MKLMFLILIYSIPLTVSAHASEEKLIYSVETEEHFRDEKEYVVEREYKEIFNKAIFEASVKKVFTTLNKSKSNNIIEVDLENCNQSIFVERFFKTKGYDAHLSGRVLKVYTKKMVTHQNENI